MNPHVVAQQRPDHPALIMATGESRLSYAELDHVARQLATAFRQFGLRAGDHVALLIDNEIMFHPVCWGAWIAGLYFTPISTRLTSDEVKYILADSGSRIVVGSPTHEEMLISLRPASPGVEHWLLTGQGRTLPNLKALAERCDPLLIDGNTAVGADMLYSSGTTGRPKGIKPRLSSKHDDPDPLTQLLSRLYGFSSETRYLNPAPLYHGSPLKFTMGVQRVGGTVVLMERFDAEAALAAIERHRVTHSQWVPTMLHRLVRLPEETRRRYGLSSHRVAIHSAAPCPPDLKRQVLEWWGPMVHEFYSGSEAIGFTAIGPDEWLARPGSVGRPVLGELHIMREDGSESEAGEVGQIYFSGGPPLSYHNDPEKTRRAYNDKGWISLGDMGWVDEEDYLYLSDRKDFMIITGGVNVYPKEIEDSLSMHPEVGDVAVFGVPHPEFGQEVKAVIQPVSWPVDEAGFKDRLLAYARSRMSPIKLPRSIDLTPELPRDPNGKLYKARLRQQHVASLSRG